MNEQNLDINLVIQSFQEKVNQLTTELVIKEATIKQLMNQIQANQTEIVGFETPTESIKKAK